LMRQRLPLPLVEPLPDDPPVPFRVYPGGQSAAALLLVLPEPVALLLDDEPALPPAPALPVVLPDPVGTQPAGMLSPSARLPLPAASGLMLPEPVPVVVPVEPDPAAPPDAPVVVPVEPDPAAPPDAPDPLVCASAVPAASIAANVKANTLVIVALSYTCGRCRNAAGNAPFPRAVRFIARCAWTTVNESRRRGVLTSNLYRAAGIPQPVRQFMPGLPSSARGRLFLLSGGIPGIVRMSVLPDQPS
jgi:hypothetical protein